MCLLLQKNPSPSLPAQHFDRFVSFYLQVLFSEQSTPEQKISALRRACDGHVKLTRECSKGLGQDRHLYALYCLLQREMKSPSPTPEPNGTTSPPSSPTQYTPSNGLPLIFTDPGWALLNTSILSSSNCGNPALRLFGFGPVAADGFGIGYIIKDEGVSMCVCCSCLFRNVGSDKACLMIRSLSTLLAVMLITNETVVPLQSTCRRGGI
jgi:Choline/Carnitine o-acyltransferase